MKRHVKANLTNYLFRFAECLGNQIEENGELNSMGWREIEPDELENEIFTRLERFWVEFSRDGIPMPWLKIASLALIGWVRANYPKTYVDPD